MGEPERREAFLFFSLFFAQVKDPKAREIIFEGAHNKEGEGESSSAESVLIVQRFNAPSRNAGKLFD